MLKKLQEKSGFLSIELIIIAGLMIGLGAFAINEFYQVSEQAADGAIDRVNEIMDITAGA